MVDLHHDIVFSRCFFLLLCIALPRYNSESVCNFGWEYTCVCILSVCLFTYPFMNQLFIQQNILQQNFIIFFMHFEKDIISDMCIHFQLIL